MGAITFSIDENLLAFLSSVLPLETFVETGTFHGDSVSIAKKYIKNIISIEISYLYYEQACSRFSNELGISLLHGDSSATLSSLSLKLENQPTFYWLDSHAHRINNLNEQIPPCSLLDELKAISILHEHSVIAIDDAHLFQASIRISSSKPNTLSEWPLFDEILDHLTALSSQHAVMIINDCILFYPQSILSAIKNYAAQYGVDWLSIVDKSRDYDALLAEMTQKEQEIQLLKKICQALETPSHLLTKHKIVLQFSDTIQLPIGDQRIVSALIHCIGFDAPISPEQKMGLIPPPIIQQFPDDLHNSSLEYSGLHEDGWIKNESYFHLTSSCRTSILIIKGTIHCFEDKKFSPILNVFLDGKRVLERQLALGEFDIKIPVFLFEKEQNFSATHFADLNEQTMRLCHIFNQQIAFLKNTSKEDASECINQHLSCMSDISNRLEALYKSYNDIKNQSIQEIEEIQERYQKKSNKHLSIIQNQEKTLNNYRSRDWKEKFRKVFQPKLGILCQHSPCSIKIPDYYHQSHEISNNNSFWPSISIVTPAFRHGDFIEATLKSVLGQGYPILEYVVKDGGSIDSTTEILKRYGHQLTYWESTRDKGQSQAINIGFTHTTGEIMAYLNSDDLLLPGALHYVAKYFKEHPDVDVIYGHRILIDENGYEIGRWILPPHQDEILTWSDYIPQETLFWRRSLWNKVNAQIDESFQFAMDWDLILRFREAGAKFIRLPRFLGAFRIHPEQKSSACISDIGIKDMTRLRERCHGRKVNDYEIQKNTRAYLRCHQWLHLLYKMKLLRY